MVFHGKWYDEVQVGDSFGSSVTVTESHIVAADQSTSRAKNERLE